jgi:hypothetical protein
MSQWRSKDRRADGWQALARQAQRAAPAIAAGPPAGFVERVLAARATGSLSTASHSFDRRNDERLIAWAACLALAASLALFMWNWPEIETVWGESLAGSDAWVQVEPWL